MEWMTAKEAGVLWGVSTRRVAILCATGKVSGAQKLGNQWAIPKDALRPIDGRTKAAKNKVSKDMAGD